MKLECVQLSCNWIFSRLYMSNSKDLKTFRGFDEFQENVNLYFFSYEINVKKSNKKQAKSSKFRKVD